MAILAAKYTNVSPRSMERMYALAKKLNKQCGTLERLRNINMMPSHFLDLFSRSLVQVSFDSMASVPSIITDHPLVSASISSNWNRLEVMPEQVTWLDGDSFRLLVDETATECRVFGIDSPELDTILQVELISCPLK